MSEDVRPLNDEQMAAYVRDGHIAVNADYPAQFHRAIHDEIESVLESEGNPGNNILPRVPLLQDILHHPGVVGALTGILGPDYDPYPHRFCHFNPPGSEGQTLHKDSLTRRQHRTRWAMAMYYPQDVSVEMGPTGVVPGSHYYNTGTGPADEVRSAAEAGEVRIVHYDIWHRGTPNTSDRNRYMVKFLFTRMVEPESPSWDGGTGRWSPTGDVRDRMWSTMWDWHRGYWRRGDLRRGNGGSRQASGADLDGQMAALRDGPEPEGLNAAYELAALGADAVAPLVDVLRDGAGQLADELAQYEGAGVHGAIGRHRVSSAGLNAVYALAAIGAPAVPALRDAVHDDDEAVRALATATLSEMGREGRESVPDLLSAFRDESTSVRWKAAEALGTVGAGSSAVPDLINALGDEDWGVRRSAVLTLARLGPPAEDRVAALVTALRDPDKYVRGKAALGLEGIHTAKASEAVLKFLEDFRWA